MKIKDIPRTATFAWSPFVPLQLATGTVAGALDESFSNDSVLEIWDVHGKDGNGLRGSISADARFHTLRWSPTALRPQGVIAAGMETGEMVLWDPATILSSSSPAESCILRNTTHTHALRALAFNALQPTLLASGSTGAEVFIWDLNDPSKPYTPTNTAASGSLGTNAMGSLAWNAQVQHVLAGTAAGTGVVWDLRGKREVVALEYGGVGMGDLVWCPDNATRLMTAADNGSILAWDLRNARAPEKILSSHTQGVLSLSWCRHDPSLLLSAAKDGRALCWDVGSDNAEVVGELAGTPTHWAFQVDWSPRNPDIWAVGVFGAGVGVWSVQALTSEYTGVTEELPSDGSLFDLDLKVEAQGMNLTKAPNWLKRPASVAFGFGGKLVSVSAGKKVEIRTVGMMGPVKGRVEKLVGAIEGGELKGYLPKLGEEWRVLGVKREEVPALLGVETREEEEEEVSPPPSDASASTMFVDGGESTTTTGVSDDGQVGLFGEPTAGADFFSTVVPHIPHTESISVVAEAGSERNDEEIKIYSDPSSTLTHALLHGDFSSAITTCLENARYMDAMVLAVRAGDDSILSRVREAYFASTSSVLRSVVEKDVRGIVEKGELARWKEIIVYVCTYAKEDFGELLDILGGRLDGARMRHEAVLCYLVAGRLGRLVRIWEEEEKGGGEEGEGLVAFVEKVEVFRALSGKEPNGGEGAGVYARLSEMLAAQGMMAYARVFMGRVPEGWGGEEGRVRRERVMGTVTKTITTVQPAKLTQPQYIPSQPTYVQQQSYVQPGPYGRPPTQQPPPPFQPQQSHAFPPPPPSSSSFQQHQPPPPTIQPTSFPHRREDTGGWNDAPVVPPKKSGTSTPVGARPESRGFGGVSPLPPPPPPRGTGGVQQRVASPRGFAPQRMMSPPSQYVPQQTQSPYVPQQVQYPLPQQQPYTAISPPPPPHAHPAIGGGHQIQPPQPPHSMMGAPPRAEVIPQLPLSGPPRSRTPEASPPKKIPVVETKRYSPGDRSHIPPEAIGAYEVISAELERLVIGPSQKRDITRRINALFDALNNGTLDVGFVRGLGDLGEAMRARDRTRALAIHVDLLTRGMSGAGLSGEAGDIGVWMSAVKQLVLRM